MTDPRALASEGTCQCGKSKLAFGTIPYRVHNPACPVHATPASEGTEPTLKPCPFCGGEVRINRDVSGVGFEWSVECGWCSAYQPGDSKDEAVAAWNRRALPVAPAAQPEVDREAMIQADLDKIRAESEPAAPAGSEERERPSDVVAEIALIAAQAGATLGRDELIAIRRARRLDAERTGQADRGRAPGNHVTAALAHPAGAGAD